jgi:hypothetical protein
MFVRICPSMVLECRYRPNLDEFGTWNFPVSACNFVTGKISFLIIF